MQRLVKNLFRVSFKVVDSEEVSKADVVAKTRAYAVGEIMERYGTNIEIVNIEELGARTAVMKDDDFYRHATFIEPKKDIKEEN